MEHTSKDFSFHFNKGQLLKEVVEIIHPTIEINKDLFVGWWAFATRQYFLHQWGEWSGSNLAGEKLPEQTAEAHKVSGRIGRWTGSRLLEVLNFRERDREESNKLNSSTGALALDGGWRRQPKQVKGPSDWFIVVDLLRYGPTDWLLPCNTIGIPSREALPIRLVLLLPPARTKWRWSKNVTNDCKQTHIPPLNKWVRKMDFDYP